MAGLQLADVVADPAEFALFRTSHDRRLQVSWEAHKWPDVCVYERRSFRAPWSSATTYAAGAEVLDLPSLTYFQALQPSTNQPPTFGPYTNQSGQPVTVNSVYWAQSLLQYQLDPYVSNGVYTIGSQVLNLTDGLYYQLFALPAAVSVVVSGAGDAGANGTYGVVSQLNGKPRYQLNGDPDYLLEWDGTEWTIAFQGGVEYQAVDNVATPDLAMGWVALDPSDDPVPTVVSPAIPAPPNPTYWGVLTPFNRYVGWTQAWAPDNQTVGEFLAAWDFDPRITTKTQRLQYLLSADGAQFTTLKHVPAYVWLLLRTVRPQLFGDPYDTGATYAAGQQMYFADALGNGNFYNCVSAATANQNPTSNPALWAIVNLPYVFRQYLIEGGYADWLRGDGQTDKATAEETVAEQMLEFEADKLQRQQQQVSRLTWKS